MKTLARLFLMFSLFTASAGSAARKSNTPYIGYAYPAGVKRGTEATVIIGGMNFRRLKNAVVSGKGVKVLSVKNFKPFKRLRNDARREIMPILKAIDEGRDPFKAAKKIAKRIQKRIKRQMERTEEKSAAPAPKSLKPAEKPKTKNNRPDLNYADMLKIVPGEKLIYLDITPKKLLEKVKSLSKEEYQCLLKMVFTRKNALQTAPAIAQIAILRIQVAPTAETGFRELRLVGREGASNPLKFEISDLPEMKDTIYRIGSNNSSKMNGKRDKKNRRRSQTKGGNSHSNDYTLLEIGSIANGQILPGEVDKYRFKAKKNSGYAFELEGRALIPYLSDAVPGWFQPIISIHDSKGNELAFADDNLFNPDPVLSFKSPYDGEFEIRVRDSIYRGREDFVYRLKATKGAPAKIAFKTLKFRAPLPRVPESESNDSFRKANKLTKESIVEGAIGKAGDVDLFAFEGKKGEGIVAEVFARRLDSPLDSVLKLLDSHGKTIAWSDDYKWPDIGLKTHMADSYLMTALPADGEYYLKVYDARTKGGADFKYLLRLDKPRPDFRIYTLPSAINARTRISTPFEIRVWRIDGFDGTVTLKIKKGPKGAKLAGTRVPAEVKKQMATITIPPKKTKFGVSEILFSGEAIVNGRRMVHDAVPSDDIMQAFLYRTVVPAKRGMLCVPRQGWLPVRPPALKSLALAPGETKEIRLFNYRHGKKVKNKLRFELLSPPKGLSLGETTYADKHFVLHIKAAKDAKPWRGSIIIQCVASGVNKKNGKKYSYPIGAIPAIPAKIAEQ